jgi:type III secretion protein U
MNESSEEKTQPASERKLREARKKGQVAKSHDLVAAMVLLGCTLGIALLFARVKAEVVALLDLVVSLYQEPFAQVWPRVVDSAQRLVLHAAWPILAITVLCVVLTHVVALQGLLFSADPIKPEFKRINPVEGFKRIFSLRNLMEFLKGVVKVVILATALYVVGRIMLQALMESSRCGTPCVESVFLLMLQPLLATVLITFLAVGGADVLLQRWLFQREMRMTRSEYKRERKDVEGDPLVRRERNRQRREMGSVGRRRLGLSQASLVIGKPDGWVVAVRYVRGETSVPLLVSRAEPGKGQGVLEQAQALGLPCFGVEELARHIGTRARPGEPIPNQTFQAVADALVAVRLL